ncbi:unnamed protein product [Effrenium voratum]|nr:unnamed protein product [Effrenium voratum]
MPAALYVCWELQGSARAPVKLGDVQLEDQLASIPAERQSILFDERVECFVWQPGDGNETYFAFEINFDGKALTNRAKFGGHFDFGWDSSAAYSAWTKELPVGLVGDVGKDAATAASGGARAPGARVVIGAFRWQALGIDRKREIRIGLTRAQHPLVLSSELGQAEADAILKGMIWTTWVDPDDAEVNCHRAEMFGRVKLEPAGAVDCSCCAARLLGSKDVTVLRSPEPSLDECPPGSLLIRAKYASLCGSDFPYFRDMASRAASCYWDRDGFCGHEAVGVVVDSRSERFCVGDSVLSLPSSYFKAHVATRQEWFDEKVHGVLLEDFPVRGGFSEVFPSHELYTYKIKECVPRMLAAQALGTLLRMVRRLGTFIGKTVVILGQGQNGLLATRLMAQSCARHVIAVEPLASRRALATQFGATHAVTPQEAPAAVFQVAPKGADLVLEMVGHNQETIKEALELVAPCGIVTAFGVPDDSVYMFQYAKFFRKNATLVASVIPDPGVDFPEAVELVEQGRFSTEGIFTHTFPLSEIQKAFTIASECLRTHWPSRSDAIIIGAGVIGNAVATELSRSGMRTLNVDKLRGSGQGSTGYSSGICRMMYSLLDSVKFAWEGYTYYENWKEHIGLEERQGTRLPQPQGPVRLFPLFPEKVRQGGTVLVLHGEEEDWLGNRGPGAVPGGATHIAQTLREEGFTAVLLDSFFDGRRSRLEEEANRRVSDILAALVFLESRDFPSPFHLYGHREGTWPVMQLLAAPKAGGRVAMEAKWATGRLSSCLCDCSGLGDLDVQEFESLQTALESSGLPPSLLMADPGAEPLARQLASALSEGTEPMEERELLPDGECRVLGHVTESGHVRCVLRCYDRDGDTDVSAKQSDILAWLQRFDEEIWAEDPPGGLARLRACGALTLRAPQSKVFLERVVASHRAVGLPFEEWDADEIRRRLRFDLQSYGPQVRIDDDSFGEPTGPDLSSGVYFPKTGYVSDPMLAACNLQAAAQATGRADFAFGREVTELLRRGGRAAGVRCGEEVFEAPVVINVAGPHSSQITRLAFEEGENDMAISTRPMRQEVAYVNSPPNVSWGDDGEGLLCTDLDTGIYFRPEVGGKILVGSVEPSCDDPFHIYPSDPEAVYPGGELASLTDQWTNQVYRLALRVPTLPLPEAGNVQGCAACYDVTEDLGHDWVPIYDKSALPGFYMAIGTSGNQFKNAGPAARLMRELIEACACLHVLGFRVYLSIPMS